MKNAFSKSTLFVCTRLLAGFLIVFFAFSDVSYFLSHPFEVRVQVAEAAAGDFAIFRETTGTETVDATIHDSTWDTTVVSNANIALQANNSDIDLADGGKYLVLYNVWTEQGTSTAGSNRRSLHSWLTLGGTQLEYGHGDGYLRDSDNTIYAHNNGAAIIDAVAGDDLQVHVARDDANSGAGTNIRADTNGITVLKLKDTWDYLRIHKSASSTDIDANTTFTDVTWDTSDEVDTGSFGFTPTSGNVTLKGDDNDHFLVTANVKLNRTSSNTRENYEMILTLDGTEIPGTLVTAYPRGDNNGNGILNATLVYTGIIKKDTLGDQTLNVEVRRESTSSGGTTIIAGDQTALSMVALSDDASYIMLTDNTGSQALATTRTGMDWNTQLELDTYAFSHSTSTNSNRVNIDTAGDYLFFSTVHATTSSDERQPHRIDWRKNSATIYPYGGHSAYNRGNQSFSAGSSGGILMDGLTSSDYIEATHFDETEAPVNATFNANRISLQGVLLDENFFGTDVYAAASSSHLVTLDIPTTTVMSGGQFVIEERTSSRNVTNITMTESGTVDGQIGLDNIELWYDFDETTPYDCASESFDGDETKFGDTDTSGFSGANGVSSFSGSAAITTTKTMCAYVKYDVTASSSDSETVIIGIANPSSDITVSGGGSVGPTSAQNPTGSTTLRNAELTQIHYHWRNDDGSETTATSIDGAEDTSAIGFANGTTRRLRVEVSAEGSTSSPAVQYRLEYAQKSTTCDAATGWTDVGTGGGGDWDIVATANLTDGNDTTNVALAANGAVTDTNDTFLTPNGAQKDTSSQTGNIALSSTEFVEIEYALEPTAGAPQGNTYCFRVTDAGTPLRNYDVYAEGTISADIDVSASGAHTASLDVGSNAQHVGGTFVIARAGGTRTVTDITVSEIGSIDAAANLADIELWYDLDTSNPYDCASESYAGGETQFGATDTDGFSTANGTSTFTGSETVSNTRTMCLYAVMDVGTGAVDGETIQVEITNPSTEVVVTSSSVGPSTAVGPTGSTTVAGPVLTQTHFHWRNDDGNEGAATSQTAGTEDVVITEVPKERTERLRMQVSNEGSVTSQSTAFRLEYGTKITTCENVGTWSEVGVGAAFDMSNSTHVTDGADATDIANGIGGVTNENTSIVTNNNAIKDTSANVTAMTLTSTEYVEFEFALEATIDAGDDTTYCFRLTDAGTPLEAYTTYPEMTTREKQDFYIQRGTTVLTGTTTILTAGIDYTAPSATSAAFVRITNSKFTGAGESVDDDESNTANGVTAYIEDQTDITANFRLSRPSDTANSVDTRVSWEIIEFVGIAGTDNEMIVRDAASVTYSGNSLYATGTSVSTVADDSDVVVFITGQYNPDTSTAQYNDGLSTSFWHSTSTVPVFTRNDATNIAVRTSYAVVEFTGVNWAIQRVEHAYTSTSTETENITAVNSLEHTFIHAQKRVGAGETGLHDMGHEVHLSSVGAVSFQLEDDPNNDVDNASAHDAVVWIMENMQTGSGEMTVQRSSGYITLGGAEPVSNLVSIPTPIDMDNASIFVTNNTTGEGAAFPRGIFGVTITSATQYELWASDTGQNYTYRTEVIEWPVAEISRRQNYYRFYVDNDALDPTDPWPAGATDLGENTSITALDEPLGEGEIVRIRMTMLINNANLPALTESYKLQYGKRDTTCSSILSWSDVGAAGSGEIWRGYDASPTDGTSLSIDPPTGGDLNISVSDVAGTYEEENNSATNPFQTLIGEDMEFDWVIQQNGALQKTDYCFRMVESDDTELTGYNNYPTLRTSGYTPVTANWRWYDDATSTTPVNAMALENVAPIDVSNENEIKLRVTVSEIEGASGANAKFSLQYSQYPDFSDGGTFVHASSSCSLNSLWCYTDAAGTDGAIIDSGLLTDSDTCTGGLGAGCGTHNEGTTTASILTHTANTDMEFEFALKQAGARVNSVYYFRLYDVANDDTVFASSSYPSLVTEGAGLSFILSGVPSASVTEGITTDVATAATSISYGALPLGTEVEAAHRLTVQTNATEGYQVLMYSTGSFVTAGGSVINAITASNSSPASWASSCLVTETGCFGYHSGDDTLQGGSTRFSASDTYAQLDTTPQEIIYSSVPVATESTDVVYKIQVRDLQEAGQYETGIVYIAIPVF